MFIFFLGENDTNIVIIRQSIDHSTFIIIIIILATWKKILPKRKKEMKQFSFLLGASHVSKKEEKKESRLKAATLCSPKSRRVKKN